MSISNEHKDNGQSLVENYYIVDFHNIYYNADSTCFTNVIQHSVRDTSLGCDIQIKFKEK